MDSNKCNKFEKVRQVMSKETNNNQQVETTRKWIMDALIKLMGNDEFNKITISQIASQAQIDRRTFYRHYKTKEDVLDQYLLSLLVPHFEMLIKQGQLSERQLIESHFRFLTEHLTLLRLLKSQNLFGYLLLHYQGYIKIFQNMRGISSLEDKPDRFRMAFKTGGFWNIVTEWIEDEPVKTPEEITGIIHNFLEGGIDSLCYDTKSQ
jgi:AcrR family transcriptional regulator